MPAEKVTIKERFSVTALLSAMGANCSNVGEDVREFRFFVLATIVGGNRY